jgi:hypothetical protein
MKFKQFKQILTDHAKLPVKYDASIIEDMHESYEPADKKPKYRWNPRQVLSALSIMLFAGLIVTGGFITLKPTHSLSIDINPGFELLLNRFGSVVKVNAIGDEAAALKSDLRFWMRSPETVLENIVSLATDAGYVEGENPFVLIYISGSGTEASSLLLSMSEASLRLNLMTLYLTDERFDTDASAGDLQADNYFVKSSSGLVTFFSSVTSSTTSSASESADGITIFDDRIVNSDYDTVTIIQYMSVNSDQMTLLAEELGITLGKLQLVISIFNGYSENDTYAEFLALTELPISDLYALFQAIPE